MFELSPQDQAACIDFLRDLIRIPSLPGQEQQVAERIMVEMRKAGFAQVYADQSGNIIARLGGGTTKLLFNGHMDTVGIGNPRAWSHDPFDAFSEKGVIYGRGAADMKGGLAAMVYGAKLLTDAQVALRGELIMAAVVQNEPCEGLGIRLLLEDSGLWPSFVILGDPTNLALATGHRGRLELRINTEGRACHSSRPELGENALYAAARLLFGVELLSSQLPEDPALGQASIAVTGLNCVSGSRNMVPDLCQVVVDRRLTLSETQERAIAEIHQVMDREGVRGDVRVADYEIKTYTGRVLRGQEYYPPWLMPPDALLIKTVGRALEGVLGARPRTQAWRFSTDGSYTRGVAGIPTVGFGPGQERYVHAANEQIAIADVLTAARGYAHIAWEILGKGLRPSSP